MTAARLYIKGFTLIELLVVISIIAILATLVFVALNPVKRYQDARNSKRWNDANSVLAAIQQYVVDNDGALPTGIDTTIKQLGTCSTGGNTLCTTAATACLDLSSDLATYLKSLPVDPQTGSAATTGYTVVSDANGFVTISACSAEASENITVSR